jgi:hypothetical protein
LKQNNGTYTLGAVDVQEQSLMPAVLGKAKVMSYEDLKEARAQHHYQTLSTFKAHLPTSSPLSQYEPHSLSLLPIPSRRPALNLLREACHNKRCSEGHSISCGM